MKTALIQMNVAYGNPSENYKVAEQKIREAAAKNVETIVLPELWNTGFDLENLSKTADTDGQETQTFLKKLAKELGVHIVGGSVATKKAGDFYNTTYVITNEGEVVADYDKAHLFRLMDEHLYIKQGSKENLFALDNIPMASVICYDVRFPEWLRLHALKGARVLFVPAQWPANRMDHWKTLLQARAIENQCYVVAVNIVGENPGNVFDGHSMVIDPWGEIQWISVGKEEIGVVDIDLDLVEEVRGRIPVFDDRRESLYSGLLNNQ